MTVPLNGNIASLLGAHQLYEHISPSESVYVRLHILTDQMNLGKKDMSRSTLNDATP